MLGMGERFEAHDQRPIREERFDGLEALHVEIDKHATLLFQNEVACHVYSLDLMFVRPVKIEVLWELGLDECRKRGVGPAHELPIWMMPAPGADMVREMRRNFIRLPGLVDNMGYAHRGGSWLWRDSRSDQQSSDNTCGWFSFVRAWLRARCDKFWRGWNPSKLWPRPFPRHEAAQ